MNRVSSADRRGFLSFLVRLSLVGASQLFPLQKVLASGDSEARPSDKLCQVCNCRESASVIGREYLRIAPDEAHKSVLVDLICQGSPLNQGSLPVSDIPTARMALQELIRKDFELGRTVLVNGWLLSRTESRICALITLST